MAYKPTLYVWTHCVYGLFWAEECLAAAEASVWTLNTNGENMIMK